MKRFIINLLAFALVCCVIIGFTIAFQILLWQKKVNESMWHESWQRFLFMGDSHIGCTFVELPQYENRVIWDSSLPQQFTLMRLCEMERRGLLSGIEILVLDFGLQSIGQQRKDRMKELWWRMLPFAYKYSSILPLSFHDYIAQIILSYPNSPMRVMADMPDSNVSIMSRSMDEREYEFAETAELHFDWINHPEQMCRQWERSLKDAISEIHTICNRNGIKLIFITAPLTSYYNDSIPILVEDKLQEFIAYIKRMGIPYYDLRRWGSNDDFRDSFHFRLDGATRFTEWFYGNVLMPLLKGVVL